MGVKEAREHVLRERHITNTERWKVPPNLSSTRNITRGKTFTRNDAQPSFWKTSRIPMLTGHICGTVQLEPVLLDEVQKQQEYPRRHCVPSILSIMSKRLLVVNVLGSVLGRSDSLTIQEEQFLARKERGGGQGNKKRVGLRQEKRGGIRKRSRKPAMEPHQYQRLPILNPLPPPQLNELLKDPNQSGSHGANNNLGSSSRWLHLSIWLQHIHSLPSAHSRSHRGGQACERLALGTGGRWSPARASKLGLRLWA